MFSAVSAQAQTATQAQTGTQTQNPASTTQTGTQGNTQNTTGAPSAGQTNTTAATPAGETKTAVTVAELPAAVKTTLASPTLNVWTAYEAYLVKDAGGKEYYAINLKKDTQTGSVKLDKEGKPVK